MKRTKIAAIGLSIFLLIFVTSGRSESWNGITPLKSTRQDVERILGLKKPNGYYEHEIGKVWIMYGSGIKDAKTCIGRAPTDVVAWINVIVDMPMNFRDLNINEREYRKVRSSHLADVLDISNEKVGITYSVDADNMEVHGITYWPAEADCKELLHRKR